MSKLRFWKIEQGDEDLARRVQESYVRLYARQPKGYVFEFLGDADFTPREASVHFVVGTALNRLLGYASCQRSLPTDDISKISQLHKLDDEEKLTDTDENAVTRENLAQYLGYSTYTGKGEVLHVGVIEVFRQGRGIGSELLDFIKAQGYELIELEANGSAQAKFFRANDFADTGIDPEQPVMVWNNPKYATPKND